MHAEHSDYICALIGLGWVFSGGFVGYSYTSYRLSQHAVKLYKRFILSLILFAITSAASVLHYVIHPN